MNYIQDNYTLEIFEAQSGANDLGRAMTYRGKTGRMKNFYIASKDMWCPFFNPDGIEFQGDNALMDVMMDASNDFTSVSSATFTPPSVDCEDPIGIGVNLPDDAYKSRNTNGTTNIFVHITSSSSFDTFEFSTKRSGTGGANGLDGSGYPVTWKTYTKGSNGYYNIDLPSTGLAEVVWVRKIGCGGNGYWGRFITYNPDMSDPLFPETGGGDPPPPSGNAVIRSKPMGVTFWGLYGGRLKAPFNGVAEHHHKTHYAEQSSASGVDRSGNKFTARRPFYAIDGYYTQNSNGTIVANSGSTTVPVGIWSPSLGTHVIENRYADTDWQMTMLDMDKCITYLIASGLQFFRFEYYGNGYDGSLPRTLFEQNTNKRGVKACYTVGSLSGGSYSDVNSEYRQNVDHFVWALGQDWYQRIDGKPMITYFYNWGGGTTEQYNTWKAEKIAEINLIRDRYNAVYPTNNGLYEVYCTSGGSTDMSVSNDLGLNKRSWYYLFEEQANGNHNMDEANDEAVAVTTSLSNANYKVIPSLNLAMNGLNRAMYPGNTYQWTNPSTSPPELAYNSVWENGYYNNPSDSQLNSYFNQMESMFNLANVEGGVWGTADEFSEGGEGVWMPRKRADGSIDDRVVRLMNARFNPNYILP